MDDKKHSDGAGTTTQAPAASRPSDLEAARAEARRLAGEGVETFEAKGEDDEVGLDITFIFQKPTRAQLSRYMKTSQMQQAYKAGARLCKDVAIHPKGDDLDALFERHPGLVLNFIGEIMNTVGGGMVFTRRKL